MTWIKEPTSVVSVNTTWDGGATSWLDGTTETIWDVTAYSWSAQSAAAGSWSNQSAASGTWTKQ